MTGLTGGNEGWLGGFYDSQVGGDYTVNATRQPNGSLCVRAHTGPPFPMRTHSRLEVWERSRRRKRRTVRRRPSAELAHDRGHRCHADAAAMVAPNCGKRWAGLPSVPAPSLLPIGTDDAAGGADDNNERQNDNDAHERCNQDRVCMDKTQPQGCANHGFTTNDIGKGQNAE